MRKEYQLKNYQHEQTLFYRRIMVVLVLLAVLVAILLIRLFHLQVIQHQQYTTMSRNNLVNVQPVAPSRGLIYDRNHHLLAENVPAYNLELIPGQVPNLEKTLAELQTLLSLPDSEIKAFMSSLNKHRRFESIPLHMKLSDEELAMFYVNQHRFPGVSVQARLIRHYPLGKTVAHILGYVGRLNAYELNRIDPVNYRATNTIGKIGAERAFEKQLHGQVGYQQVETDARGRTLRTLSETPPQAGHAITLTIDSKLMEVAEQAMGKHRGAVVAVVPNTGEILALTSTPSYDPNPFVTGLSQQAFYNLQHDKQKPLYNRAIRGRYPPASTVKPFLALGSLALHVIDTSYKIYDPGWFRLPNSSHKYRDWKPGGHGWVNVTDALIVSSDTFFYNLAAKLGIHRMYDIYHAFHFGDQTDIELKEELAGVLPSPAWKLEHQDQNWYRGDTVITGIGQGYALSTPLQLAQATAIIATRGQQMQAKILLQESDGKRVYHQLKPELKFNVNFKAHTWQTVIDAMRRVIKDPKGTGWRFGRDAPYTIAAKTGTGELFSSREWGGGEIPEKLRDNSLFIAFAPIENPQIAIAVMVENAPKAGPVVARRVLDYFFRGQHA